MGSWAVRAAAAAAAAQIDGLLRAKAERLGALESRLRLPRSCRSGAAALVAVDPAGRVGAHLLPELRELGPDDEMRAFAAVRAVTWRELTAVDPVAFGALVRAARLGDAGDAALWPAADRDAARVFADVGLRPVFAYAVRGPEALLRGAAGRVRAARPADADAVAALHVQEVAFHETHTPYVRVVPALEPAIRSRLEQMWAGVEGASVIYVIEVDGTVVGMCESMVQSVRAVGGQLPPGRYGYLNSVAIDAPWRGRGLGRALVSAVVNHLAQQGVDGFSLWFALGNPLAGAVWPRLGFQPLWISYERRVPEAT